MTIRKLLTKTFCFAFLTTLIVGCGGNKNPGDQGGVSSDESQSQSTDARFGGLSWLCRQIPSTRILQATQIETLTLAIYMFTLTTPSMLLLSVL